MRVDARQHVDLLVLLVQQVLQVAHLSLEHAYALLKRLCISTGKSSSAELVAGLAFEAHVEALGTAWADAVAAYLLGATAVACLGNARLVIGANLDHLHGKYTRHVGEVVEAASKKRGIQERLGRRTVDRAGDPIRGASASERSQQPAVNNWGQRASTVCLPAAVAATEVGAVGATEATVLVAAGAGDEGVGGGAEGYKGRRTAQRQGRGAMDAVEGCSRSCMAGGQAGRGWPSVRVADSLHARAS